MKTSTQQTCEPLDVRCPDCKGCGQVLGYNLGVSACPNCNGDGLISDDLRPEFTRLAEGFGFEGFNVPTVINMALGANEALESLQEENGRLLKALHKAWEETEDIQRMYDDASDAECRCGIDPEGHCPHCSKWEKADAQVSTVRSLLEEQIPKDYEP